MIYERSAAVCIPAQSDNHHPVVSKVSQRELEQRQGGLTRPLQIIEQKQQRAIARDFDK